MADLTETIPVEEENIASVVNAFRGMSVTGIVKIVVLAVVLLVLVQLIMRVVERTLTKSRLDRTLHGFLKALCKITLYGIAVLVLAESMNVNVTSLIAVLSVAGLALSLALQGSLSNVASGIVILVSRPFRAGDLIQVGECLGTVLEISMTYTQLLTADSRKIFIPNSNVTSGIVKNYTMDGKQRVEIRVSAGYDCPASSVKKALEEAAADVPQFLAEEGTFVRVSGYHDSAVEYLVRAWAKPEDYWDAYYALMEKISGAFARNEVWMTYPHLNVHLAPPEEPSSGKETGGNV